MNLNEMLSRLSGVKPMSGTNHYTALCPCHNDHNPSLDIKKGDKGIVMACPVCGADGRAVMNALGLPVKELFYEQRQTLPAKPQSTDYFYTDSLKKTRYHVWSNKKQCYDKSFCWYHKSGTAWQRGKGDVQPPLYKQGNIAAAINANAPVYIVEGEKDVDTLTDKLKLYAVCSPHGAGKGNLKNKWRQEYNALFEGAEVVIIPDNDEPGKELAKYIAAQLAPVAKSIKIPDLTFEWQDLKPKGDITDIFESQKPIKGKTIAQTVRLKLEALTVFEPLFEPDDSSDSAEKKAASAPSWVYREGKRQKIHEEKYITEFADNHGFKCINNQLFSVDGAVPDGRAKQLIIKDILPYIEANHGDKAEKLLRGIKTLCYSEPPEPQLDKLHFKNGTLSKDSNGLFTVWSSEKEFCINRINTDYNPHAAEPERFLKYLDDVYHSDDRVTLQQYCGYCLLPTTVLQKALIIIGAGGEGKSVLGAILNGIFGEANFCNDSISVLEKNFGVANVENKLIFIDDDLSENALNSTRNFKSLVTNNTVITANKKFVQENKFKSFVRFLCFGNFTLHALYDTSDGFTRRQLVLEAKPKDPNRIDDPFIHREIIENESEGVLLWLIDGLNTLIQNNFKIYISDRTQEVSDRIKEEADSVSLFLNECRDIKYSPDLSIRSADLVYLYNRFCEDNVLAARKDNSFIAAVRDKGKKRGIKYNENVFHKGKRARGFSGIGTSLNLP